jgi:hypothetical protein
MSTATLYSLSAVAGIIAGISIILGTLLNDLLKTSKGTFFNFLGALIGLFGLTGVYLWQRNETGIFGVVAYIVVFIGMALVACTDYSGAFVTPNLSEDEVNRLSNSPVMMVTMISFSIFLVGEILFGISTIITGVFPWIPSVLFIIGFLATVVRPVYQIITFFGLTLSGIGLIWWGVSLWSMAGGI